MTVVLTDAVLSHLVERTTVMSSPTRPVAAALTSSAMAADVTDGPPSAAVLTPSRTAEVSWILAL